MEKTYVADQPNGSLKLLENQNDPVHRKISSTTVAPPLLPSKRILVVAVLFLCLVVSQVVRNHINITVVEMTSNKSLIDSNITIPPEFDWDSTRVALVISIFAYGGLFSFLGGFIVNFLGGSVSCAVFMVISGITTLLHPYALNVHFYYFLACRFITGLSQTFLYVSVIEMYSRWFPLQERSKLVSFSFNGSNVGVAIVYPFSGYLAHRWGWETVFYVTGTLPLIMAVICLLAVKNHPSQDKFMSKEEREYIIQGTDNNKLAKTNHPYKKIVTSGPVWALCCLIFVYMWIVTNLGVCLPLYVKDVTQKNTDEIGWISAIPSVVYTLMFPVVGPLMDHFSNRGIMSLTRIHKIMVTIAFTSATIFFIASTFLSNLSVTLSYFVVIDILMSTVPLITEIVVVSIAPDHTSIVAGLVVFFFSLGAIFAATITGLMITHHTVQEWNNCFYLAAFVAIIGTVIFVKFGSSRAQKWALSSNVNKHRRPSLSYF
ncbi:vesicular glutamate transporter 3-like [Planococcus citri]|uniref:vesicular glutamate transporter 3-like n=1 Tax=Planococcus citri TaxID=170843 RepID=UPI0031F76F70